MATALENATGWVETQAPELTGKSEAAIVARLKQFEVPAPDPVVAWFDTLTDEELDAAILPGTSRGVRGWTVIRIGRARVELRNSYGYPARRRTLRNVQ